MKMYMGTLYRFGYDLQCLCKTKEECKEKLMKEYERVFRLQNNDEDPREDIAYEYYSDLSYYDNAKEDIEIREYEIGKVGWC